MNIVLARNLLFLHGKREMINFLLLFLLFLDGFFKHSLSDGFFDPETLMIVFIAVLDN
jgi:hypothetical protein